MCGATSSRISRAASSSVFSTGVQRVPEHLEREDEDVAHRVDEDRLAGGFALDHLVELAAMTPGLFEISDLR